MADLEAKVPQEIEDRLDHLFAPRGGAGRGEEGDVDVRMRCHFAPAIAADRHQGQPLAGRAVGGGVDVDHDMVVDHAQQLIDQVGLRRRGLVAVRWPGLQPLLDLGAALCQRGAQIFDHAIAGCRAALIDQRGNPLGQRAAVDQGAGMRGAATGHR